MSFGAERHDRGRQVHRPRAATTSGASRTSTTPPRRPPDRGVGPRHGLYLFRYTGAGRGGRPGAAVTCDAATTTGGPVDDPAVLLGRRTATPLPLAVASQPARGTVGASPANAVVYTPHAGFVGQDAFTYTADDGALTSALRDASGCRVQRRRPSVAARAADAEGRARAPTTSRAPRPATCSRAPRPASGSCGGSGNDVIDGGAGDDCISGQNGNDDLAGDAGNDDVMGGARQRRAGRRLRPRRARRRLRQRRARGRLGQRPARSAAAGTTSSPAARARTRSAAAAGDDTISARGGGRDTIDCGAGRDTVTADKSDKVAKNCEVVRRR